MNKTVEAIVNCLSDHFSSRNKFGIKLMKNVLEVLSLSRLLGIEQF
jgi:hypothetical protein